MLTATGNRRKKPAPPVRITENDIRGRRRKPQPAVSASFRNDIQGLRALAIMMVVSMHVGLMDIHGGVDVSFVISGFLNISIMLKELDRDGRLVIRANLAKRFRRIVPGAALVIAATTLLAWIYTPLQFKKVAVDGSAAAVSLLNWRLVEEGTDYFANDGNQTLFQHYWSLCIEEQFYLLAPIVLATTAWVGRRFFKSNRRVMAVLMLGVIGWSFYSCLTLTETNQPLAYFGTHTRIWELGIGVMLALTAEVLSRMNRTFAAILSWLGLGLLLTTAMMISDTTPLPGYAVLGPVLGSAMIVAGGCASHKTFAWCKHWSVKIVADVSYSWYLIHWPVLLLWEPITGTPVTTIGEKLRVVVLSFILSCVTYYPYMKRLRATTKLSRRPHFSLAVFGLAICSVATLSLAAALQLTPNLTPASAAPQVSHTVGTAAVTQAVNQKELPGNVQPALIDAPDDKANYGCIDDTKTSVFKVRSGCILGDKTAAQTVVVLGDSHAWHWGDAFHQVGRDLKVRVITATKGGCSAGAYDIENPELKRDYSECTEWRRTALAYIAKLHPDVVVVSARIRETSNRNGMDDTFSKLKATGAKLVYMTDVPTPKSNVPNCLARHPQDIQSCGQSADKAVEFPEQRAAELASAKAYGATIIDTTPALCSKNACPVVIGNTITFFDNSHLTATYAKALVPFLEPKLKLALTA